MSRIAALLELRRDGGLDAAGAVELAAVLADPATAREAIAIERDARLLAGLLAGPRDPLQLAAAARTAAAARRDSGRRVAGRVRRRIILRALRWPLTAAAAAAAAVLAILLLTPRPTAAGPDAPLARHAEESIAPDPRWEPAGLLGLAQPRDGWLADGRMRLQGDDGRELQAAWVGGRDGGRLEHGSWRIAIDQVGRSGALHLAVTARSSGPAPAVRIVLTTLAGPPAPGRTWPVAALNTRDELPILTLDGPAGALAVVAEAEEEDLVLACGPDGDRCPITLSLPAAAAAIELRADVRFGTAPPGREPTLVAERCRAFAARHPLAQRWGGLRRLGMFGFAGGALSTPSNPNCWFGDQVDLRTVAGRDRFRELLLAEADAAIADFRRLGVDGVVVWGLEGCRYLNDVGFIADPRRLAELAPEMDAAADALFARFDAAGLRHGMLVRPWRFDAGGPAFRFDGAAGESEITERIAYASRRWGSSIFVTMFAANGWHSPAGMRPDALRRIAGRFPGATLVTDLGALAWRGPAAGWDLLSSRQDDAPRLWQRVWPEARDLLFVDMEAEAPGAASAVRNGLAAGGVPLLRWGVAVDAWRDLLDGHAR